MIGQENVSISILTVRNETNFKFCDAHQHRNVNKTTINHWCYWMLDYKSFLSKIWFDYDSPNIHRITSKLLKYWCNRIKWKKQMKNSTNEILELHLLNFPFFYRFTSRNSKIFKTFTRNCSRVSAISCAGLVFKQLIMTAGLSSEQFTNLACFCAKSYWFVGMVATPVWAALIIIPRWNKPIFVCYM